MKGFPSTEKLDRTKAEHPCVVPVGYNQAGMMVYVQYVAQVGADDLAEAGSTVSEIAATAHGARKGDVIRFTTGSNAQIDVACIDTDTDVIYLGADLPSAPGIGDTFQVLRGVTPTTDASGAVGGSGPVQFVLDGSSQQVIEDTGTPANNRPLPVKLTGVTGDITISAQNLNVQLTDGGANPDRVRIGDGTNQLSMNGDGSAKVGGSGGVFTQANGTVDARTIRTVPATNAEHLLNTRHESETTPLANRLSDGAGWIGGAVTAASQLILAASQRLVGTVAAIVGWDNGANVHREILVDSNGRLIPALEVNSGIETSETLRNTPATDSQHLLNTRHEAAATPLAVRLTDGSVFFEAFKQPGKASVELIHNDNSSVNITTAAYVQLVASSSDDITRMHIFDSSGQGFIIATGAAASEVDVLYVPPGGSDNPYDIAIPSGTRLSVKAMTADMTVGDLIITALK